MISRDDEIPLYISSDGSNRELVGTVKMGATSGQTLRRAAWLFIWVGVLVWFMSWRRKTRDRYL